MGSEAQESDMHIHKAVAVNGKDSSVIELNNMESPVKGSPQQLKDKQCTPVRNRRAHGKKGSLSAKSVLITATGAWKLGGFGFTITTDQASSGANVQAFHYDEYDEEDSVLPLQPSLNYTAPELVRNKATSGGWYSDIFSLGCLAYHLVARKPLLDCHNNVKMVVSSRKWPSISNYRASVRTQSPKVEMIDALFKPVAGNEHHGMFMFCYFSNFKQMM